MSRDVPQLCLDFLAEHEAEILHAYDDADPHHAEVSPGGAVHGKLTAGYGHTGPEVFVGMTVTHALALDWLAADAVSAAIKLAAKIGDDVIALLTDNQYAAMISFVFNLGTGDPKKPEWTIWKRLRAKDFEQVPGQMAQFVNGQVDGKMVKIQGLVNRRAAEMVLWSMQEPGSVDLEVPSSVTRSSPTPPTPADPVPTSRSKAIIAGGAGAIAGAGPIVDQVSHAIAPYAQHSHYVDTALGVLATIAAVCASVGIFYMVVQKRNMRN